MVHVQYLAQGFQLGVLLLLQSGVEVVGHGDVGLGVHRLLLEGPLEKVAGPLQGVLDLVREVLQRAHLVVFVCCHLFGEWVGHKVRIV